MEAIYGEIVLLQRAIEERRSAINFLDMYEKIEQDHADTLIPIGGGLYVETRLPIVRRFYVHVGANIYLIKSTEDAKKHLEKSIAELEKALNERNKALSELRNRYEELSIEISEIYMKLQGRR
jgi:prefoldin alpha subunit